MKPRLHLLNSHGRLDGLAARIEAGFEHAITRISPRLPLIPLDVVLRENPAATLPELGIGGFCPAADLVFININAGHPSLGAHLESELSATLAHELHHAARWAGPGYGSTLLEALVSEGLACSFEAELRGSVPFYARALSATQLKAVQTQAMSMRTEPYNHAEWFFGTGVLPRHAGYSLGLELVSRFIQQHGGDAASLAREPASRFASQSH